MIKKLNESKVVLAGAGPGDPELITVKTLSCIQRADVLIVDRLVDHSLLNHAKLGAKIFFVGKEGGNPCSFTQESINELIVTEAKLGRLVLRLKGGDVSFFSNIFSELDALINNNISYEIIPGVTAASGAAAYAGIPLTARGYANSVRFLACINPDLLSDNEVIDLASTEDTLVLYMSSKNLPTLISKLIEKDNSAEKWVAVIEQATTPNQRVTASPIDKFLENRRQVFQSPSIVIVGKVAKLYSKFSWNKSNAAEESFFPSVEQNYSHTSKVA